MEKIKQVLSTALVLSCLDPYLQSTIQADANQHGLYSNEANL